MASGATDSLQSIPPTDHSKPFMPPIAATPHHNSPSAPDRLVSASVRSLRRQLDATTAIWVGGSAPALASLAEPGVRVLGSLGDIAPALQAWNAKRTAV